MRRILNCLVLIVFCLTQLNAYPQISGSNVMPARALNLLPVSALFQPVTLKGLRLYANDPFKFDFILDEGNTRYNDSKLKEETSRLISYFLACLTVPEKDLWVNLSPYEKNRIIPSQLATTQMGADMLRQDYILKRLAASLTYPETEWGKKYWQDMGINNKNFQKVWIVPGKALVYADGDKAYVGEATLKVMCEEDYLACRQAGLAMQKNNVGVDLRVDPKRDNGRTHRSAPTDAFKTHILPLIEKEVNQGKNFSELRQMYKSLILAAWFKKHLKENVINKIYTDKNKVKGVNTADKNIREKIYNQYLQACKDGAYSYIKNEQVGAMFGSAKVIKRSYFSGGFDLKVDPATALLSQAPAALVQGGVRATAVVSDAANVPSRDGRLRAAKTLFVNKVLRGLFVERKNGKFYIYANSEILDEHMADFRRLLGENATKEDIVRFVLVHEIFHALAQKTRKKEDGEGPATALGKYDEEYAANIFAIAAIYSVDALNPEESVALDAISRITGFDVADILERNSSSVHDLLEAFNINAKIKFKNTRALESIRASVEENGGSFKAMDPTTLRQAENEEARLVKTMQAGDALQGLAVEYKDGADYIYFNEAELHRYQQAFKDLIGEDLTIPEAMELIKHHEGFHHIMNKLRNGKRDLSMVSEEEEDRIGTIFGLAHLGLLKDGRIPFDLYWELDIVGKFLEIDLIDAIKNHPGTIEGLLEKFGIKVIVEAKTPAEMKVIKAQAHKEGFSAKGMWLEVAAATVGVASAAAVLLALSARKRARNEAGTAVMTYSSDNNGSSSDEPRTRGVGERPSPGDPDWEEYAAYHDHPDSKVIAGVVNGVAITWKDGRRGVYILQKDLMASREECAREMGVASVTQEQERKFLKGHEALHALGIKDEELADIFGKVAALGAEAVDEVSLGKLRKAGQDRNMDLVGLAQSAPYKLRELLNHMGLQDVEMEIVTRERMDEILAQVQAQDAQAEEDVGGIDAACVKVEQAGRGIKLDYDKSLSGINPQSFGGFKFEVIALTRNGI